MRYRSIIGGKVTGPQGLRKLIAVAAVTSLGVGIAACGNTGTPASANADSKCTRIAMIPKTISDPYFKAAYQGAQQAATQLGVTVAYRGAATSDTASEVSVIQQLLPQHYCALTVSALDPDALAPVLKQAMAQGIKVTTFDADVVPGARTAFLNQATYQAIGQTIVQQMAKFTGGRGNFLILTSTLTAPNQSAWVAAIKQTIASQYPNMKIGAVLPANSDQSLARTLTLNYLQAHPDTTGIMTVDGNALVGVAPAIKQLGLAGKVKVTGIGVPSLSGPDLKAGIVQSFVLWDPVHIGYCAIYMTEAVLNGTFNKDRESGSLPCGNLGDLKFIGPSTVLLGNPTVFTPQNVDEYHF